MEEIRELIFKKALSNAYKHEGKASKDAVIRKIIFLRPDLRQRIKEIIPLVEEIIEEVNRLSLEEQYNFLLARFPEELKEEKIEKRFELPKLEKAEEGKVVTRFAPNPDGPLHIGNIRAMLLSFEYAKLYKGKFILRLEDTDPRTKKPILHVYEDEIKDYEYILRDLEWFGAFPDEIHIQSDRLKIYYELAKQMIEKDAMYVCFCSQEEIKQRRAIGKECIHRSQGKEINIEFFDKIVLGEYYEKQPVLRIKTDLNHPDPSVRDWIAFRVIDPRQHRHPRIEKIIAYLGHEPYLWPTYNFASCIDDHLMKVTHVFRAKEHMGNTVKQSYIYKAMGWDMPVFIHYGRLKFEGAVLSKSKIISGIKSKIYEGFDDVDLATISSFRRRGFLPEAIKKVILELGYKPNEAKISFENLHAANRKIIDPIVDRYFFVSDPLVINLNIDKEFIVKRQLHPSRKEFFEYRIYSFPKIYISKSDMSEEMRLIELGNVKIKKEGKEYIAEMLEDQSLDYARRKGLKLVQWVYENYSIDCEVKVPSYLYKSKKIEGKAEAKIKELKPGTCIQFVRCFFAKLDKVSENKAYFYYLHD